MLDFLKRKKNIIPLVILIVLLICVTINNVQNKNLKDHYERMYEVEMFDLSESLMQNNDLLKNKIANVIIIGKINNIEAAKLREISANMYYTYHQLRANCINNSLYVDKNYSLPKGDIFLYINNHINNLQLTTNCSDNEMVISSEDIKSLKIISSICTDISGAFKNYKCNLENGPDMKRNVILNEEWLNILSKINSITDNYQYELLNGQP